MIPSEFNQDAMAQRRKLRVLHEARGRKEKFKIGDRVKLTGKSGETQKKHGFSTTGKIKDAQISSGKRFFRVGWDDGKNSSLFDLQSRLGLDVVKEEVLDEAVAKPLEALVIKKNAKKFDIPWNVWKMSFDPKTRKVKTEFVTRGGFTRGSAMKAAQGAAKRLKLNILDTKIFRQTALSLLRKETEAKKPEIEKAHKLLRKELEST
jgi:hypothetical protein